MAAITAKMVADLRTQTGCGMMECKKALTEANGDFDEAVKVLREKGLAVAAKKASRIAAEGVVDILVSDDKKSAAMIEVNAETDFVAKNAIFLEFVQGILKTILNTRPADVAELLTKQYLDTDMNVEAKLKDMIFTIGENMNIRRFVIVDGVVSTYIHGKGTTGVIVKFNADDALVDNDDFAEFSRNIALQVAGMPVPYLNRESVPADVVEKEKAINLAQMNEDPKMASKPEQVKAKIIEGKIKKYFSEVCLLEQTFVRSDLFEGTVAGYVASVAKALGADIKVTGYTRLAKGEGIEKKVDDFAAEVASMM
jgi:elongation factor Ts